MKTATLNKELSTETKSQYILNKRYIGHIIKDVERNLNIKISSEDKIKIKNDILIKQDKWINKFVDSGNNEKRYDLLQYLNICSINFIIKKYPLEYSIFNTKCLFNMFSKMR